VDPTLYCHVLMGPPFAKTNIRMGHRKTEKSHKIQLSPTFSDRVRDPYSFHERVSSAYLVGSPSSLISLWRRSSSTDSSTDRCGMCTRMSDSQIALPPLVFSYTKCSGGERLTEPTGFLPEGSSRFGVVGKEAKSAPYGRLGAVIDLSPFFLCDSAHLTNEGPKMGPATEIAAGSDYLALIYQSPASSLSSSAPLWSQLRDNGFFWLEVRSRTRAWYRARMPPLVELSASGGLVPTLSVLPEIPS
ncbi:hypothetical protein U1Q18_022740, partial [Sarracenia purpurea var. burkii]